VVGCPTPPDANRTTRVAERAVRMRAQLNLESCFCPQFSFCSFCSRFCPSECNIVVRESSFGEPSEPPTDKKLTEKKLTDKKLDPSG